MQILSRLRESHTQSVATVSIIAACIPSLQAPAKVVANTGSPRRLCN